MEIRLNKNIEAGKGTTNLGFFGGAPLKSGIFKTSYPRIEDMSKLKDRVSVLITRNRVGREERRKIENTIKSIRNGMADITKNNDLGHEEEKWLDTATETLEALNNFYTSKKDKDNYSYMKFLLNMNSPDFDNTQKGIGQGLVRGTPLKKLSKGYPGVEKMLKIAAMARKMDKNKFSKDNALEMLDMVKEILYHMFSVAEDKDMSYKQKKGWFSAATEAIATIKELCKNAREKRYLDEVEFLIDANLDNFHHALKEFHRLVN
ncbi:hypothetical protein COU37_05095 [Candidatus Micrarchaeota archaeon CG10_big_fil_rev_8_21_14_0_10_45_29]|nr:MAG: hypothetical protein COU37_05095 [Candidatus Micrarchaeota archaeon CG10_big_fil_rev_8_21_14_0_10_45_29]